MLLLVVVLVVIFFENAAEPEGGKDVTGVVYRSAVYQSKVLIFATTIIYLYT
jgi:hypothetical protein